jgi:replicative DNA helicase
MAYNFSDNIQRGILNLAKSNLDFFNEIAPLVKSEYFEYPIHTTLYEGIVEFFGKYHKLPNDDFLLEFCKDRKRQSESVAEYEDEICFVNNLDASTVQNTEFIVDCVEKFARRESMKQAITKSVDLMRDGRFDEIEKEVKDALLVARSQDFGQDYFVDTEARWERLLSVSDDDYIKTCLPSLDRGLNGGGLRKKELAMVVAPPGVGKSLYLANQAVKCLIENLKVVYISLEMSEDRVGQRIDSISTLIPQKLLGQEREQKMLRQRHKIFQDRFPKANLRIKEFPTGMANVNTIRAYLNQLKSYEDFVPDVLVIDYMELLRPVREGMSEYEAQQRIAEELRGIGVEQDMLIWTATQTNRAGRGARLITDEHLGDSYGKFRVVDLAISLNQDEEEFDEGMMRTYVMKARNGKARFVIPMTINYNVLVMQEVDHDENQEPEAEN